MSGAKDYVVLLDGLDLLMRKDELERIADMHNKGVNLKEIGKQTGRNLYEVIAAILEWTRQGHYMRAFGKVSENTLLVPGKEILKQEATK